MAESPDITSPYVTKIAYLIPLEYTLFLIISGCFIYFGVKFLSSYSKGLRYDKTVLIISFLSIATIYILAFSPELSPNGDNAEYLIMTKSLVEKGGVFHLYMRNEPPNTLGSIGLPVLLSPIYVIWGYDFIKMKILIMVLGLLIFPILFKIFRKFHGFYLSGLLTIICFSSPYMVSSARSIMTEVPYIFWSLLSILLILNYLEKETIDWKFIVLIWVVMLMTFATRPLGVSIFFALCGYLFIAKPWYKIFNPKRTKEIINSVPFKRILYLIGPILLIGVSWQIKQELRGVSQAGIFLDLISNSFVLNLDSAIRVIAPVLFSYETYRWVNFSTIDTLSPMSWIWTATLLLILFGLISGLIKKQFIAIYTVIVFILVIFASTTAAEMVIIRYLIVIMPFLAYYFLIGCFELFRHLSLLLKSTRIDRYGRVLTVLGFSVILLTNLLGNTSSIAISKMGYGPSNLDYRDVAEWCGRNLPEDAYILSVKPRLFYLYSNRKGARLTSIAEQYSEAYEKDKIKWFRDQKVTHIIIDAISHATRNNIVPIVENNPDLFQTLYVGELSRSSAVLKIKDLEN